MKVTAYSALSEPQRSLVERMQKLNFGRIEALTVRNGLPVFDPQPKVIRDIKLGGEPEPRADLSKRDFELKPQVVDLFTHFRTLGDATVECLEIKHGLPFRLVVQE